MSIQSLLPATVDMIMSGLDSDEWRTAEEIAAIIHRDAQTTRARLRALRAAGKAVECQVFQLDNGGDGLKWRKLPPGSVAPIYERRPGWDDRAVTEALTGYTPTERPIRPDEEPISLPPFSGSGGEFGGAGASGSWDSPKDSPSESSGSCRSDNSGSSYSSSDSSSSYSDSSSSSSDSGSSCSTD
jgi:hypothetical protein